MWKHKLHCTALGTTAPDDGLPVITHSDTASDNSEFTVKVLSRFHKDIDFIRILLGS
jgi:hypothetical protein